MDVSDKFFTVVFSDPTDDERKELTHHAKFSAWGSSHALNDRDDALFMLSYVESVLTSISVNLVNSCNISDGPDAEEQAKQALPRIRDLLRKQGRYPKPHKSFQDVLDECYSGVLS